MVQTPVPMAPSGLDNADIRNPASFLQWLKSNFQSSVMDDIYGQMATIIAWSTMVSCLHLLTERDVTISSAMLGVLGGLLGFVVSLRTSSAYERYCEGRRVWSQVFHSSRYLTTLIWLHINNVEPRKDDAPEETPEEKEHRETHDTIRSLIEKQSMFNLIIAYAVALKHFCRQEPGLFYEDLYPLVSFLPKHSFTSDEKSELLPLWQNSHASGAVFTPTVSQFDPSSVNSEATYINSTYVASPNASRSDLGFNNLSASVSSSMMKEKEPGIKITEPGFKREKNEGRPGHIRRASTTLELMPSRMPPKRTLTYYLPVIGWVRTLVYMLFTCTTREDRKKSDEETIEGRAERAKLTSNVPLSLTTFMQAYIASLTRRKMLDGVILGQCMTALDGLQTSFTALERLINSALPFAYQLHLKMTVWIFMLILPFQIVQSLGWYTILVTAITAFFYFGFVEIGVEIENPFDFGKNDLDLDSFCSLIAKEVTEITAHPAEMDFWGYGNDMANTPFALAGDKRSVPEILKDAARAEETGTHTDVLNSIKGSIAGHFRQANSKALLENSRKYRHRIKKQPRKKIIVDYADRSQWTLTLG